MSGMWTPLFTQGEPWAITASAALLCCVAAVTTLGAIASKPFVLGGWWETIGACSTSFFAGWTLTAAGLSIGITTRVNNRGMNAVSTKVGTSPFPLALSVLLCVLSVAFGNPILSVPFLMAILTVQNVFRLWWLYVPALVALGGVAGGIVMLFVYRGAGTWW